MLKVSEILRLHWSAKNDYETAKSENIGTDFIITWEFSVTFHQNIVQHFEMFGNTAIFGIQRGHMLLTVQMHASPIVPKLSQLKFSLFFSQSSPNILRLFDKKMITSWQGHILSCPGQLIRCYSSLTAKDINLFQSVPFPVSIGKPRSKLKWYQSWLQFRQRR